MCSIKDNNDDDDLLLYCEGDEAEKNKDRLLSFDAKKYELVTTDEKLDDGEEFEFNGAETYESSPSDKFSPTGKIEPNDILLILCLSYKMNQFYENERHC